MDTKDINAVVDAIVHHPRFDALFMQVAQTSTDVRVLNEQTALLEQRIERLTNAIDKLAKSTDDLMLEYASIKMQMNRHERWFKEISEKMGLELKS